MHMPYVRGVHMCEAWHKLVSVPIITSSLQADAAGSGLGPSVARAVSIQQVYGASYWHLLLEVAPRLLFALPLLRADAACRLIMPATSASRQLLRLLRLDPNRIAEVPRGGVLLVHRLAFPTSSPFTWHTAPPREWLLAVRAALLPRRPPSPGGAALFPASLSPPPGLLAGVPAGCTQLVLFSLRRSREAAGLGDARRAAEARLGPEPGVCTWAVEADQLTLVQQIALFGAAGPPPPHAAAVPPRAAATPRAVPRLRALVGSHGANLAHALWAARPCALLEVVLPPPRPAFDNYLALAAALGLAYWLVPAYALPHPGSGFAVDPQLLVRTLERALALPLAEPGSEILTNVPLEGGGEGPRLGKAARAAASMTAHGHVDDDLCALS